MKQAKDLLISLLFLFASALCAAQVVIPEPDSFSGELDAFFGTLDARALAASPSFHSFLASHDYEGLSPIQIAAKSNPDPEVIRLLVREGCSVSAGLGVLHGWSYIDIGTGPITVSPEYFDNRPITLAAIHNPNPGVIQAIIQCGASVDERDYYGITPLMRAIADNPNPEVVAVLINCGAKVNGPIPSGAQVLTPLAQAVNRQNPEVIKILLGAGVSIEDNRDKLEQGYWDAAYGALGELWALELLPKYGPKLAEMLDEVDVPGNPVSMVRAFLWDIGYDGTSGLLSLGLWCGNLGKFQPELAKQRIPQEVLNQKAMMTLIQGLITIPVNPNGYGVIPLTVAAAISDDADLLTFFAPGSSPIDTPNDQGITPLMVAAANSRSGASVRFLLERGADTSLKDSEGKRALDYLGMNPYLPEQAKAALAELLR